ncbi:MAG: triose-phosphate isomerase [Alphaproteobacteria bacterium]
MENHKLIIANWKMNGSVNTVLNLLKPLNQFCNMDYSNEIIICPPYTLIQEAKNFSNSKISLGAQNCSDHTDGAFTGEISAKMLAELGCKYVIIGHSERRKYYNETSKIINSKILLAHSAGLKVILCIGEDQETRNKGNYLDSIYKQLNSDLNIEHDPNNVILAYEPLWSIGTGNAASIEQIEEIHFNLSERFENKYKIVYGGSVNGSNAHDILAINSVAGVLVGAASLNFDEFKKIIDYKN